MHFMRALWAKELPRKPHNKRIRMKNPVGAKSPDFICLFAVSLIIRVYSRACSLRRLSATPGAYPQHEGT